MADKGVANKEEAQHRKRSRDKEHLEISPPIKRRSRASENEEFNVESLESVKEFNCEMRTSDHSEGEFAGSSFLSDQMVTLVKRKADHIDDDDLTKSSPLSKQMGTLVKGNAGDSLLSLDDEAIRSNENLSSCDASMSLNETECESLESSLLCLGNSLEDVSENIHNKYGKEQELDVGNSNNRDEKKKRRRKNKAKGSKGEQEEDLKGSFNVRPNYFVAVQISDPEIHKSIVKVQEDLVAFEPALFKALVDVATSHITLLIARIDDDKELSVASSALEDFSKTLLQEWTDQPIQLTFSGIDNFSNSVVYANVVQDDNHRRLLELAEGVRQAFKESGVFMPNMKPLNPHLTIAKMSKAPRGKGKQGPRKIEPVSYGHYKDIHFGCQRVNSIQLLAMNSPKDQNRYYYCCKEIMFDNSCSNENYEQQHSQCCHPRRPIRLTQPHRKHSTTSSTEPKDTFSDFTPDMSTSAVTRDGSSNIFASTVGYTTALAASLMVVYVVGKVSGKL